MSPHTCKFRALLRMGLTSQNCWAEREGFEPSVPLGLALAEFGSSLVNYSARLKFPVVETVEKFPPVFGSASASLSSPLRIPRLDARNPEPSFRVRRLSGIARIDSPPVPKEEEIHEHNGGDS